MAILPVVAVLCQSSQADYLPPTASQATMTKPRPKRLTFVHLSDIHFREGIAGTVHDIDSALREAIEVDLLAELGKLGATLDGILVTGDIAFAGKSAEYTTAKTWLRKIAGSVGLDPGDIVYCVPGNHDVDRDVVDKSVTIKDAHSAIRAKKSGDYNKAIRERLSDPASAETLFSSMHAYNREFAWIFGCACKPETTFWEEDVPLNDGSNLLLRGLSSTLLSGYDKEDKNDLVLGRTQTVFPKHPNTVYLTMCHHPPDWCWDCDLIEDDLHAVKIQLFGHKHRARVTRINNTVRLSAGAVHPDRNSDWKPGYNIFQVWVEGTQDKRKFRIEIHAREWQEAPPTQFKAYKDEDGEEVWKFEFGLLPWDAPASAAIDESEPKPSEPAAMIEDPMKHPEGAAAPAAAPAPKKVSVKSLMFRFSLLPFSKQSEIIAEAGLVKDDDRDVTDVERFIRAFKRASEQEKLTDLEARINAAEQH